jgi:hypothetical protein
MPRALVTLDARCKAALAIGAGREPIGSPPAFAERASGEPGARG